MEFEDVPFKFDVLLKSIFDAAGSVLLNKMGFHFTIKEALDRERVKLHTTLKPDFLYLAESTTYPDEKYIVHIDFQSGYKSNMLYRMGEYWFRIAEAYLDSSQNYKIVQCVIYFGLAPNRMQHSIRHESHRCKMDFEYILIDTNEQPVQQYLDDPNLNVNLLGFLCSRKEIQDFEEKIKNFLQKLKREDKAEQREFVLKMMIVSDIRKFKETFEKVYEEMPLDIDVKNLPFVQSMYSQGLKEGEIKGEIKAKTEVLNKLLMKRFPNNTTQIDELIKKLNTKLSKGESLNFDLLLDFALEANSFIEFKAKLVDLL